MHRVESRFLFPPDAGSGFRLCTFLSRSRSRSRPLFFPFFSPFSAFDSSRALFPPQIRSGRCCHSIHLWNLICPPRLSMPISSHLTLTTLLRVHGLMQPRPIPLSRLLSRPRPVGSLRVTVSIIFKRLTLATALDCRRLRNSRRRFLGVV